MALAVALPDGVEIAHRHVDRLAGQDLLGHVDQHAVAHLVGVVQPDQGHGDAQRLAEIGEDPLAAQAAHGVVADRAAADRSRPSRRRSTGTMRVDVAGRVGHDPAAAELLADHAGQIGVHGPGASPPGRSSRTSWPPGRARWARRAGRRTAARSSRSQRIVSMPCDCSCCSQLRRGEPRHADHPPRHAGRVAGPAGHAGQASARSCRRRPARSGRPPAAASASTTSGVGRLSSSSSCSTFSIRLGVVISGLQEKGPVGSFLDGRTIILSRARAVHPVLGTRYSVLHQPVTVTRATLTPATRRRRVSQGGGRGSRGGCRRETRSGRTGRR